MKKQENTINLKHILKHILNNIIIIIVITLSFTFYQYYNHHNLNNKNNIYNMGTAAIIIKKPESSLSNFLNSNLIFFNNLYKTNPRKIFNIELKLYENIIVTNFISTDNFLSFLKKSNNKDLYNQILNQKNKSQTIFEKSLGILSRETSDPVLTPLTKIDIPADTEITYFRHKSNIDGRKILKDYLNFVNQQAIDLYLEQKYNEFNLILERHVGAKNIAEILNIKTPLVFSELEIKTQNDSLTNIMSNSIYIKGTDILQFEIQNMRQIISNLENIKFDFDLILDTPFIFYSEKKPKQKVYTVVIKYLVSGLVLSLIIVFLKSFFTRKKKTIKKKV